MSPDITKVELAIRDNVINIKEFILISDKNNSTQVRVKDA